MIPSFHCAGRDSAIQISRINLCIFCLKVFPPYLISSPCILSVLAALFVFNLLIIEQISLYVGGASSSWTSIPSLISCGLSGTVGIRKRFWKYSFHLSSTSSICEIVLPMESLQVVGNAICRGLKIFIFWKNFRVWFLFLIILYLQYFVIHPCFFLLFDQNICFHSSFRI